MTGAQRSELDRLQLRKALLGALGKPKHDCPIKLRLPLPCRACNPRRPA